ncbi:DUF2505 domain-containing protein [Arcanobacterium ihumii]|uniref:DUF2505 domain-containing protein n=1 Tax=Arcanobacterium ihumii TaxID=2138162 RepID=UPI000F51D563|nr:DUF2505 domain-containing protein [Arcanobacterium ihumii]
MKFSVDTKINASFAQILQILPSEELAQARAKALGLSDYTFSTDPGNRINEGVDTNTSSVSSELTVSVQSTMFPAQMRSLLPRGINAKIKANQVPSAQSATIHFDITILGAPVKVNSVAKVLPESENTVMTYVGDIKVSVPFLGGGIEKKVVEQIPHILGKDAVIIESVAKQFGNR